MLRIASEEYGYELNLAEIASIWRAGCIIRARFLNRITEAFRASPSCPTYCWTRAWPSGGGTAGLAQGRPDRDWPGHPRAGVQLGSLAYYDSYRSARLPANLIQAQRDLFGAHTYERTDKAGIFHTDWESIAAMNRSWLLAFFAILVAGAVGYGPAACRSARSRATCARNRLSATRRRLQAGHAGRRPVSTQRCAARR